MHQETETHLVHPTSPESDVATVRRLRSADSLEAAYSARNELIEKYLDLAAATAHRIVPAVMRRLVDDARQEAACALIEAAGRYDPARGVPFAAFAVRTMQNRVRTFLRIHGNPVQADRLGRALALIRRLVGEDSDGLTDAQLAAKTGLGLCDVRNARPWLGPVLPLSEHDRGGLILTSEVAADESVHDSVAARDASEQLWRLVNRLSWKDRHIVIAVFGLDGSEPATIRDAVVALGFSGQRGSVRLKRALREMRSAWRD